MLNNKGEANNTAIVAIAALAAVVLIGLFVYRNQKVVGQPTPNPTTNVNVILPNVNNAVKDKTELGNVSEPNAKDNVNVDGK